MTLRFGKIQEQFSTLPRFMLALEKPKAYSPKWLWIYGRLYVGYVGLLWNTPIFNLTVWIHKPS